MYVELTDVPYTMRNKRTLIMRGLFYSNIHEFLRLFLLEKYGCMLTDFRVHPFLMRDIKKRPYKSGYAILVVSQQPLFTR